MGEGSGRQAMNFLLIGYEFAKFVVKALGILIGVSPG